MKFRPFTFVAAMSLLICVATAALWLRSFWMTDSISRNVDGGWDIPEMSMAALASARGGVVFADEELINDKLQPWNRSFMRIEWKRERGQPELVYPSLTLAQVSTMRGTARRQFSFHVLGVTVGYRSQAPNSDGMHERSLLMIIPYALIVGLAALLPAIWIYRWRKHRRNAAVQLPCERCGYSLVGNITGICPECGSPNVVAN